MYTSLTSDMFDTIDATIQRFPLTYVDGWTPTAFSRRDQLLMTMMKLKLNCPFLDLAERFCTSKTTVHNIIMTHIYALHEVFFEGMIEGKIPSLLKCKSAMPASFGDFNCCRIVIDATEVTQDVPGQDMNAQSQTYSSYKNRHTVKAVTGVAPQWSCCICQQPLSRQYFWCGDCGTQQNAFTIVPWGHDLGRQRFHHLLTAACRSAP